ncbi:MAG: hypothetical protein ACJ76H_01905 [Bacteriovoracaceae bacterium]
MLKYLVVLLTVLSCSTQEVVRLPSSTPYQTSWQEYILHNFIDRHGFEKYFPDSDYLGHWQENDEFVIPHKLPPYKVQEKPFSCNVKKLYPTHPSQATKEYLHAVYSEYNYSKLPPTSYACLTPNPTHRFCLRGAIAMMVVLSDVYVDECGNYYRGYWLTTYLKSDESMGTLFAKGRSAFEKPHAEFKGEYIEDGTYFVQPKDFMLFGELWPGDMAKINQERARALRSGFKMKGKLFFR